MRHWRRSSRHGDDAERLPGRDALNWSFRPSAARAGIHNRNARDDDALSVPDSGRQWLWVPPSRGRDLLAPRTPITCGLMFSDAAKALAQMFTPPFRPGLLKSVGLWRRLRARVDRGLERGFAWLSAEGAGYLEGVTGAGWHTPLQVR